jgi:hypothetical protein
MAREKSLDLAVVQAWLAAWDERDLFSDAAVHHLQSLIPDAHCLVVVTLGVGREPRSLVFRRRRYVLPAVLQQGSPIIVPNTWKSTGLAASEEHHHSPRRRTPRTRRQPKPAHLDRTQAGDITHTPSMLGVLTDVPSMFAGPAAPVAPPVGQLWHQTGEKLEKVLQWDGANWVIAGYVFDNPTITRQGKRACGFQEALAGAHGWTKWIDCEFIYTYDGSTWGNA